MSKVGLKNKEILWSKEINVNSFDFDRNINVVGQVYISDYGQLQNAEGQRQLKPKGIMQLSQSMKAFGICTCPIVVKRKNKYIVVDGWHRINVAQKQGLDIVCTIVKPKCSINELMVALNTTQINWDILAFLENGIKHHKNPDYSYLHDIYEETGMNLGALYEIFSFDISSKEAKKLFERGIWKITTKDLAMKIICYTEDINKYIPFSRKTNFIRGFAKCVNNKGFDINHLKDQLKRFHKSSHIYDAGDSYTGHQEMINKVYNRLCDNEKTVYLGK
tara:strand:+ start:666 stop:1493 length:828 start_codon:yes stop_codon:yes gene_type:complete